MKTTIIDNMDKVKQIGLSKDKKALLVTLPDLLFKDPNLLICPIKPSEELTIFVGRESIDIEQNLEFLELYADDISDTVKVTKYPDVAKSELWERIKDNHPNESINVFLIGMLMFLDGMTKKEAKELYRNGLTNVIPGL